MKIDRQELLSRLRSFALDAHGIVTGAPGVGKTVAVSQLAHQLEKEGRQVLLVGVADLGDAEDEDIRLALPHEGDLLATLRAHFGSGESPGVIIVDGFDAARDPGVRMRVLRLVRRLTEGSRGLWNVLVTVRLYDAGKSPDLMALFSPAVPAVEKARCIEIPLLTWEEVESAESRVRGFQDVVSGARPPLRELLRLPFNLWLIEEVLRAAEAGVQEATVTDLSWIETESGLLRRFWKARVTGPPGGLARAEATRRTASAMVDSRSLTVPTSDVSEHVPRTAWDDLLSADVLALTGPAQSRLAFGHNILFDFATALYVLRDDPEGLGHFLTSVPSRALFLRPSLVFLFSNLWEYDRTKFWRAFRGLTAVEELPVRLVSRLLPEYVLASESRSTSDLTPLSEMAWHDRSRVVLWVMQAARFSAELRLDVWAEFVADLLTNPEPVYAWEAAVLLGTILTRSASQRLPIDGDSVRSHVARGARALLAHVFKQPRDTGVWKWWDNLGARQALPLIVDTMHMDPVAAASMVRSVLSRLDEPDVPIWYFFELSQRIETIIKSDPGLAAEIYQALFSHVETSDEPTGLGGAVLRLQGTRRQDYEGAQYGLVQSFPRFVEIAPVEAIRGGVRAGCAAVLGEGVLRHMTPERVEEYVAERTRSVSLAGVMGEWLEDQSSTWSASPRDDGARMIREAARGLVRLAEADDPRLLTALQEYVRQAAISLALEQLLEAGAEAPSTIGTHLRELVLQRTIQTSPDLASSVANFLSAAAPYWTAPERAEVEQSILSIVDDSEIHASDKRRVDVSGQLLGAVPAELLGTTRAREMASAARSKGRAPMMERPQVTSSLYTTEDWLVDQGVDPGRPANKNLRVQLEPLKQLQEKWQSEVPTDEAARRIVNAIQEVVTAVDHATDVDDLVIREAWTAIGGAAAVAARVKGLVPTDGMWSQIRDILLRALSIGSDAVVEDADSQFTTPYWSPSPRTEAVQGLGSLLGKGADEEALTRIEDVAFNSPDPALRFLAVRRAVGVFRHSPDRYWQLARRIAKEDRSPAVIAALFVGLRDLAYKNGDEVQAVAAIAWPRWKESESRDLRRALAVTLLVLAVHANQAWADQRIDEIRGAPLEHHELLNQLLFEAGAVLTPGTAMDPDAAYVLKLRKIMVDAVGALSRCDADLRERQAHGEDLSDDRGHIHELIDTIATRLDANFRFESRRASESGVVPLETERQRRASYFSLIWPVVDAILHFGTASGILLARTAHHLLELFNALLKVDPATVVQAANRAVQAGRADSYNLDSLAIREVVNLMETVLADHRDVLLEGPPMEAALQLLDTFADAGWTEALELVWRLDEVFR